MVPDSKKATPSEGGHYTKMVACGISNMISAHQNSTKYSSRFKKSDTDLDRNNLYNHIKICLNVMNRIREDLLTDYNSIKIQSEFEE